MQNKFNRPVVRQMFFNNKFLSKKGSYLFFLAASVALIGFESVQPESAKQFRASSMDALLPLIEVVSRPVEAVSNGYEVLRNFTHLRLENEKLRIENTRLQNMVLTASYVQSENRQLRELLKVPPELKPTYISAHVIGSTTGRFLHTAMIDAGAKDGVEKGHIVINEHGLVGRITEVGEHTSRLLLIHDINSRIPVIASVSQERVIATGQDSNHLLLMFTPDESKIAEGEILYTSGDGKFFPSGLIVGKVGKRDKKGINVIPAVKRHTLKYVNVVKYN